MELFRWDIVIELVAYISSGIGVYAAIRSDLALMHERHSVMKERVDKIEDKVTEHGELLAVCNRRKHTA